MDRFFVQDVVALKADPAVKAIVCATWRDNEALIAQPSFDDWIYHREVSKSVFDEVLQKGKPPDGYAMIGFLALAGGSTVVRESSLALVDRAVFVGDAVKRDIHAIESGTVTNNSVMCKIQPIYTDIPYQGLQSWPHKPEENEVWVPSAELRLEDYRPGDYVAHRNWVGEVMAVRQEVTICLDNGSVVRVRDAEELEAPFWANRLNRPDVRRPFMGKSLLESLAVVREKLERATEPDVMQRPPDFRVGMRVQTKKSNLRLGHWIIGSYSASQLPRGVIVEARAIELDVDWVSTNILDPQQAAQEGPDQYVTTDEIDQVRPCTAQIQDSPYGSRIARERLFGDHCRFEREAEAEAKYSEGSSDGYYRRIPRNITQGYNMNVFNIVETRSEVEVEWQDGSRTWQSANSLVPYTTVDEHDLWPGEVVSPKDSQTEENGAVLVAKELGVVQSVDAKDRIAQVRWFSQPNVRSLAADPTTLLPGSSCGEMSDRVTSASLYELYALPGLTRRRGDIVLINLKQESNHTPIQAISDTIFGRLRAGLGLETQMGQDTTPETRNTDQPWVGEIVNVARDGKVTVRSGASTPPVDVEVWVDQVHLLISPDDDNIDEDSLTEDELMEDVDDFIDDYSSSAETIEETIEYEGGTRLDDGGEDAWMTDDSGSEERGDDVNGGPAEVSRKSASPEKAFATADGSAPPAMPAAGDHDQVHGLAGHAAAEQIEYQFNELASMPPQFLVLDEAPPDDHHFKSHAHQWASGGMLRRIKKEHKMLQSSLPRGIWVRTWADRLDLLRVLIIGPQNTPYALAPFVMDFAFGNDYPNAPPEAFFHSWTNRVGKINPNLYQDGTICLSILGTWPESHNNEAWSAEHSTMLQVIVSILGLVLVERPYYNEAGFEDMAGKDESLVNERIYSEKALVVAKGFVVHALTADVPGLGDVLDWVYRRPDGPRLVERVVSEARELRARGEREEEEGEQDDGGRKPSKGALILLERYLPTLERMAEEGDR